MQAYVAPSVQTPKIFSNIRYSIKVIYFRWNAQRFDTRMYLVDTRQGFLQFF